MPKDAMLTDDQFASRLKELKGQRFPVLSHGGITLMDVMGSDRRIVEAARTTSDVAGKGDADDRNLIRYLMRHRHSTPVEFPMVCFLVECPMDTWRQWIRHRTASVNEFSSRYSTVPDVNDETPPDQWRHQSKSNRQGSSGEFVTEWPEGYCVEEVPFGDGTVFRVSATVDENGGPGWNLLPLPTVSFSKRPTPGEWLSDREEQLLQAQRAIYRERLDFGVAKEQARKDLCLSTYTRAWWQNDLHNTLHFLSLRCDGHAQKEIRDYANKMLEILEQLFPVTCQAFRDYRLESTTLTALDIQVVQRLNNQGYVAPYSVGTFLSCQHDDWKDLKSCRERDECLAKLRNLGLVAAA